MTSFISALLAAIMLLGGIGTGSVTIDNISITLNDETYAPDAAITAAYAVEDGRVSGEAYLTLEGERLFRTGLALTDAGLTVAARDAAAVTLSGTFIDSVLQENGIDTAELIGSLGEVAALGECTDRTAELESMSYDILREWSTGFTTEQVTVDGSDATLTHLTGTVDNETMLATLDRTYRTMLGEQGYAALTEGLNTMAAEGEAPITEISDIYRRLGMAFTLDVDALVNDELFGTWDMVIHYSLPAGDETAEPIPLDAMIHMETEAKDVTAAEIRIEPTAQLPVALLCTVDRNGECMQMLYDMTVTEDDEIVTMHMDIAASEAGFRFAMDTGTDRERIALGCELNDTKGRFELSVTQDGTVLGAVSFDATVGSRGANVDTAAAETIDDMDGFMSWDTMGMINGYLQDLGKLMSNETVAALAAQLMPAAETEAADAAPAA